MTPTVVFAMATAGWTVSNQADGCTYFQGSPEGDITPIRVECDWTDVDAGKMHHLLSRPDTHDGVFGGLAEASTVQKEGALTRVYQRFAARGIGDREVVVDYSTSSVTGGKRYGWRKSADQSGLRGDAVEVPETSGLWEVTEDGEHVKLTYELRMKVGGMVPSFAMKWFQTSAIQDTIMDLKRKVLKD
jgi:hypothetical protein